MFDDPKKELQRLQEQLLAAEGKKETASGPKEPKKKPVAEKYVHPAAPKSKKSPKPKNDNKKNNKKDETGGLWTALMLELAVLAGIVIWWQIWN